MIRNITLFLFLIIISCPAYGQPSKPPKQLLTPTLIDVDFDNAALAEVVFTLSELSGAGFVWPSVDTTINWSQKGIHKLHLVKTFGDVLSTYGLTCTPMAFKHNFYAIQPASEIISGTDTKGIYFLENVTLESLEESISKLYGSRLSYLYLPGNNSIFYTGAPKIVESFSKFVAAVDHPAKDKKTLTRRLEHIPVKDAYNALREMDTTADILPDYWSRSLILRGSVRDVADLETILNTLDQPRDSESVKLIKLANITTDVTNPVLAGLYNSVVVHPITPNQLLLSGPAPEVEQASDLLFTLDGTRYQVRVEAIIASLTDSEYYELGLNATVKDSSTSYTLNSGFNSLLASRSGLLIDYFKNLVGVTIAAQNGESHGDILSSPVLTVLNGQSARLHVGQNVPFIKSSQVDQEDSSKQNIEVDRKDIGLSFEITPQIDPTGEFIHLTVNQEVSSVSPEKNSAVDLITEKKELKTTVMVADGETIFLGGLKSEESGTATDKIPLLGDLPLLGGLFTYKADKKFSRNLVIGLKVNVIKRG